MKLFRCCMSVFLMVLIVTCSLKPRGWWNEGSIAVMADPGDWAALQSVLRGAFERVIRTPQVEKTFSIKYVSELDFQRYTSYRYLVLVATLQSEGRIGTIVGRVVSDPEIRKGVEEGRYYIFTEHDQWAKDQLMVILVAKDIPSLRERIEINEDFLYAIFDTDFNQRLVREMYDRGEQKKIGKNLMMLYGWSLRLQRDYFLVQELPEEGFCWFRRMYPERWIFIRWIDGGDTTLLDAHWIIKERNRIGAEYYGGDVVKSDRYLFSRRSIFLGRAAQITSGLWENNGKEVGGPFKNYTFYDPLSRRIYMIDLAVFAPGRDKCPFLRRLDVIARTFRTIFDRE